ncbi:MAG: ABC transporter permease subunit [Fretibacterium sp.]|nr:ABC transporter permease subunit [Fretibacterium sp.]
MKVKELVLSMLGWAALAIVSLGLAGLVGFLFIRGLPALNLRLLFGSTPAWDALLALRPVWDGIWPAAAGTLSLLAVTMVLVLVPGIACGVYLACFASPRERDWIGECVDVLAGIPSIVMGLFGLELIILLRRTFLPRGTTCLLLAAACLAILVLPVLVTATRSAVEALPRSLTLTADALGLSRAQAVRHLLLPAAGPGILGGVILVMGRAMEDTAVIMLTGAVANAGLPAGLTAKFEALPFKIYYTAAQYTSSEELARGFGTALLLLILSWTLILSARVLQRRLARRWEGVA